VRSGLALWLMRRFGLMAATAAWLTFYLGHAPYVPGTWFAARSLVVLLSPAVIAGWALWVIVSANRRSTMEFAE
jgi:hypothetical protein